MGTLILFGVMLFRYCLGGGNFKKVTELCMDIFLVAPSKRTEISKAIELFLAGEYECKKWENCRLDRFEYS